ESAATFVCGLAIFGAIMLETPKLPNNVPQRSILFLLQAQSQSCDAGGNLLIYCAVWLHCLNRVYCGVRAIRSTYSQPQPGQSFSGIVQEWCNERLRGSSFIGKCTEGSEVPY